MKQIRVVVQGSSGRMGQEVVRAVCADEETVLVGAIDINAPGETLLLPDGSGSVALGIDPAAILDSCRPDVLVDFSLPGATMPTARTAAEKGVHLVIGTTGLAQESLSEIEQLTVKNGIGAVLASNFALGAVIMMHLAKIAGKYMDYAEIIELHHDKKADAPSGTALSTARQMANTKGKPFLQPPAKDKFESRGQTVEGVTIHSVRLPGLMAHQEVLFGAAGQTLSIRHDTINRECYMPGVLMAVKEVIKRKKMIVGLDSLLGLENQ